MTAVRYAGAAVCLALAAYFMAPLVMGILHIGMVYPAALLALSARYQQPEAITWKWGYIPAAASSVGLGLLLAQGLGAVAFVHLLALLVAVFHAALGGLVGKTRQGFAHLFLHIFSAYFGLLAASLSALVATASAAAEAPS